MRGRKSAASIEPPPNAAKATATSASGRPSVLWTITTVLTRTIAPPAAAARLSESSPRSRGVAR
jgi:hypothetical protein